jgi:hypothetical protein
MGFLGGMELPKLHITSNSYIRYKYRLPFPLTRTICMLQHLSEAYKICATKYGEHNGYDI